MPKLSLNASKNTKQTPAGEIPVDWGWVEIGKVARVITGSTPSGDEKCNYGGSIPFVTPGDVTQSSRIRKTERTLTSEGLKNTRLIPAGSTVVVCIGSSIGKAGIVSEDCGANQQLNAATASSLITPEFLFYAIFSATTHLKALTGNQAVPIVNKSQFSKVPIPLPPLPEQHKIADILSTWDKALETLVSLIAAKHRLKQALIQQLLNGSLRFPTKHKGDWHSVSMGSLLKRVFRPIDWSPDMQLSLVSVRRRCGGLFLRPALLGSDYKTKDLHALKTDDFLVSKRQVVHGAWGLVTDEFADTHVSKEYAIFVNKVPTKLHMPFFGWLAQTSRMIHLARVACTGVHLEKMIFDPAVFLRENISIPSNIEEQMAIARILDAIQEEIVLLRRQRDALDLQKRGLMQRLLTGKVRVTPTPESNV